jgi:type I restriction enzyme S subunit
MGSDWTEATLGNLCDFLAGSAFPKKYQGEAKGDYPFIKVSDMNLSGNERHIIDANNWVSESTRAKIGAKLHPKGSIAFAKIGVALTYNRRRILTQPTILDNNMMSVIPNTDVVNSIYFYYLLTTIDFNDVVCGTSLPYLRAGDLKKFQLQLPPLPEQRAIAHILGSLDDKIELNRRMNQTLEATARAIFKSWFVDFDPVRAKAEGRPTGLPDDIAALFPDSFEDSELGDIPKGWEVKSLNQIATYLNGLACQKYPPEKGKESLPVIKIRELRQGLTDNTDRATATVPTDYIVKDGDVLFSWSGSLMIDIWTQGKGILNQHLFKITSEKYPKWFFYYWTEYHLKEFQRIAAYKATTMGHIKRHHLVEAKVFVTDDSLMQFANEQIAPLFQLRIQNELEANRLASLRDTLLPKLISGELRVPDAEKFVEEAGA